MLDFAKRFISTIIAGSISSASKGGVFKVIDVTA